MELVTLRLSGQSTPRSQGVVVVMQCVRVLLDHLQQMTSVKEAIEAEDWKKFEETYKKAVEGSDHYHDKYDFSYIRFITPKNPPEHMNLGPPEKFSRKKKPL